MSSTSKLTSTVKIYISYCDISAKDERLKNELLKQLNSMKRQGLIEIWDVRQIRAGEKRGEESLTHFNQADIILCLLSSDFIISERCYAVEMPYALERRTMGEVRVIPVLLRDINWEETPFGELEVLPRSKKPIAGGPDKDKALAEVAREIKRVVHEVRLENM